MLDGHNINHIHHFCFLGRLDVLDTLAVVCSGSIVSSGIVILMIVMVVDILVVVAIVAIAIVVITRLSPSPLVNDTVKQ